MNESFLLSVDVTDLNTINSNSSFIWFLLFLVLLVSVTLVIFRMRKGSALDPFDDESSFGSGS